ncbi:MAG: DUF2470 domain-containing protein [Actinomycetota bacterium]
MSDDFTAEEKARMIEHMNDDHANACLLYATHHLAMPEAIAATMTAITRTTMTLEVTSSSGSESAVYTFERPLTSVEDAALFLALMVHDVESAGTDTT